jgi:hypothetical protein
MRKMSAWRMKPVIGLTVATTILALLLMGTHHHRTALQRTLADVTHDKRRIEATLGVEQTRSRDLTQRLREKDDEVAQLVRRLEGETGFVERLTWHVAQLEGQLNTLQGELALAIHHNRQRQADRGGHPRRFASHSEASGVADGSAGSRRRTAQRLVELEKVTVSPGGPPALRADRPGGATVSGRVLEVNREWQFVVVDLGWDVLAIGDVLGVYRNGALIAKVGVERVQEQVAAATILPDYREAAVAVEDQVIPLVEGHPS